VKEEKKKVKLELRFLASIFRGFSQYLGMVALYLKLVFALEPISKGFQFSKVMKNFYFLLYSRVLALNGFK